MGSPSVVAAVFGFLLLPVTNGHFNLFISKPEMNRTLGVSAELHYVENGAINNYSTKFNYRVLSNVSEVRFSWNAREAHSVAYAIKVTSVSAVLPVLRIPKSGYVPEKTEEFVVEYRCVGSTAGVFEVVLLLNFTVGADTPIGLKLKQEKMCSERDGRRLRNQGVDDGSDESEDAGLISADQVFYIIIGCVTAFLVLIAVLLVIYFRSSRKSVNDSSDRGTSINRRQPGRTSSLLRSGRSSQPFLTSTPSTRFKAFARAAAPSVASGSTALSPSLINEAPRNVDVNTALIDLYANRDAFQLFDFVELEGTFGEMRWALWRRGLNGEDDDVVGDIDEVEDSGAMEEAVLCKTLKKTADQTQLARFLTDALRFHKVKPHPNLAQLCAAATFGRFDRPETIKDFPLLCYSHRGFGILKKFLLECRGGTNARMKGKGGKGPAQPLTTHELVAMGVQIAKAIVHLHRFSIIHKDVATRNCLVAELGVRSSERLSVQLCDNALSKDLFPRDYACLGDNENRPVKWMAPEALRSNIYNSATDVWAFGVTLWELLSCAQQPYAEIPSEEIRNAIESGTRLPQPYNCPDKLYEVMFCCWRDSVTERPTMGQLLDALSDFNQQLKNFV